MVQGKITETDTKTIRLGATPIGLTSAHLYHPPIFYSPDALPAAQPTVSKHCAKTAELIEMVFGVCTRVSRNKHVLDGLHVGAGW